MLYISFSFIWACKLHRNGYLFKYKIMFFLFFFPLCLSSLYFLEHKSLENRSSVLIYHQ